MSFKIVHNLDQLSEAQRAQYLRDASEYLGLDPNLNALDLIWLNTEEGMRRLTAYARRGTTDILRKIHNISVTSLTQHDGPGYVSFTATGVQNSPAGFRTEVAVGAAFLDGLKGDRIAAAVATAQTRALRRLTLQFVGLAVLDESEVNAPVMNIVSTAPQMVIAPLPLVVTNNAPGKDVTLTPGQLLRQDPKHSMEKCVETNVPCGNIVHDIGKFTVVDLSDPPYVKKTQEQFEAEQTQLRADAINTLNNTDSKGVSLQSIVYGGPPEPGRGLSIQDQGMLPKKTRKPRGPNKSKVDLGPSEPVQIVHTGLLQPSEQVPAVSSASLHLAAAKSELVTLAVEQAAVTAQAVLTAPPSVPFITYQEIKDAPPGSKITDVVAHAAVIPLKPRLTQEQVRPFRQRLFHLVNNILEPASFMPREGMGNADKMRALAQTIYPELTSMNQLDEKQWNDYLTLLERKVEKEGAPATVKFIEESIGL